MGSMVLPGAALLPQAIVILQFLLAVYVVTCEC